MLSQQSLKTALVIARTQKENHIVLAPADSTPLGELYAVSVDDISFSSPEAASTNALLLSAGNLKAQVYDSDDTFIDSVSAMCKGYSKESQHTLTMRAIADDIALYVTSHLATARNVVVPLVTEAADAMTNFLTLNTPADPASAFKITQATLPALLQDESFLAAHLEQYAGTGELNHYTDRVHIAPVEDIGALINGIKQLGNTRLNGLVDKWLEKATYRCLERVFLLNFASGIDHPAFERDKDEHGNVGADGYYDFHAVYGQIFSISGSLKPTIDKLLAYYLCAYYLLHNPQSTEVSMSAGEYKRILEENLIVSGTFLNRLIKRQQVQLESNILVSEYNPYKKEVIVNAVIYRAWLEKGGEPEALLGFLVSNRNIMDADVAYEKKADGLRAWELYTGMQRTAAIGDLKDAFRSYIVGYMQHALSTLTDLELEAVDNKKQHFHVVMRRVEEELRHFDSRLMDELDHLALHLVAKARFYFTSAYDILETMRRVSLANPDIDPREAATVATVEYIASYLADQVEVKVN